MSKLHLSSVRDPLVPHPRMMHEIERLRTFNYRWNNDVVSGTLLACYGFFYTGDSDIVQCAFCAGSIEGWQPGNDPEILHESAFPHCPFIQGCRAERITNSSTGFVDFIQIAPGPVRRSSTVQSEQVQNQGQNRTTAWGHANSSDVPESTTTSDPEEPVLLDPQRLPLCSPNFGARVDLGYCLANDRRISATDKHLRDMNLFVLMPVVEHMATFQARLKTFETWDVEQVNVDVREMADAGFYYSGEYDRVRCFYCGMAFTGWHLGDKPRVVHDHYNPDCEYLAMTHNLAPFSGDRLDALVTAETSDHREITPNNEPKLHLIELPGETIDIVGVSAQRNAIRELDDKLPSWTGEDMVKFAIDAGYTLECIAEAILDNDCHFSDLGFDFIEQIEALQQAKTKIVQPFKSAPPAALSDLIEKPRKEKRLELLKTMCPMCEDAEKSIVFLPCSHLVCCPRCSPALKECPVCRTTSQARMRVYT